MIQKKKRDHLENGLVFIKNLVNVFRLLERVASAKPFLHVVNNRSTESIRFSGSVFFFLKYFFLL